ncbi:MAG: hypothetical protein ACPGNT_08215, partial [Rhodospirillales bacterium]
AGVAYRMLTGLLPGDKPAPPEDYVEALDPSFSRAVMAGLSPKAKDRPRDARIFLDLLRSRVGPRVVVRKAGPGGAGAKPRVARLR